MPLMPIRQNTKYALLRSSFLARSLVPSAWPSPLPRIAAPPLGSGRESTAHSICHVVAGSGLAAAKRRERLPDAHS